AGELLLAGVELIDVEAELVGELALVGGAAELRFQAAGGLAELVGQAAHVAGERVARAQIVEHRAADAELSEGLEAIDALRIEALGGLHQADHTRRDQVVDLDVGGEASREAASDLLDVGEELCCVL